MKHFLILAVVLTASLAEHAPSVFAADTKPAHK
jgi:hypothetical protein